MTAMFGYRATPSLRPTDLKGIVLRQFLRIEADLRCHSGMLGHCVCLAPRTRTVRTMV